MDAVEGSPARRTSSARARIGIIALAAASTCAESAQPLQPTTTSDAPTAAVNPNTTTNAPTTGAPTASPTSNATAAANANPNTTTNAPSTGAPTASPTSNATAGANANPNTTTNAPTTGASTATTPTATPPTPTATTTATAAASARVEARSAQLVAVGTVHGERMTIHVSHLEDNAPLRDAEVALVLRGVTHPATALADGGYAVATPDLALPGAAAVRVEVTSGGTRQDLEGTLQPTVARETTGDNNSSRQLGWWVLNFAVCIGFLWLWQRRKRHDPDEEAPG